MSQRRKWWIGLVPLLALWLGVNKFAIGDVEADLARRVDAALARVGDRDLSAAVAGRDVTINGLIFEGSARRAALDAVADVPGVRRVTDARETRSAGRDIKAPKTVAPDPQASEAAAPSAPEPERRTAPVAPPPQPQTAQATSTAAPPKAAPPEPDPRLCRDELAALMQASPIHFEYKRAEIDPDSSAALDSAAAILRRCPKVSFSVAGHWRNDRLALGRAENVIARLVSAGIDRGRLTATAAGESRPGAPEDERATDHHLEFKLR
jgi:outer membrane protein OmpA-like peptidoglycan-associated protein